MANEIDGIWKKRQNIPMGKLTGGKQQQTEKMQMFGRRKLIPHWSMINSWGGSGSDMGL